MRKVNIKIITLLIYYIIGIVPFYFMMLPGENGTSVTLQLTSTLRITDVFLSILFIFGVVQYLKVKERNSLFILLLFFLYLIFSIARNLNTYGVNCFGEYRYAYIILFLPFWIASTFTRKNVIDTLKYFVVLNLIVPLILYPILSYYSGKGFDFTLKEESRIFESDISLAVLLSIFVLYISKKYSIIKISSLPYYILIILSMIIVLLDSHRSVWLVCIAILLVLFLKKDIKLSFIKITVIIPLLFIITILISQYLPSFFNSLEYRAQAYYNPESDGTANWRLLNWEFQILRFYNNPLFGEGFGAYWGFTEQRWDIGVMPHNMYVIILAKLGLTGLIIFMTFVLTVLNKFNYILKTTKYSAEYGISLIGLISGIAFITYSVAYSLDTITTWIYFGLALAYLINKEP